MTEWPDFLEEASALLALCQATLNCLHASPADYPQACADYEAARARLLVIREAQVPEAPHPCR